MGDGGGNGKTFSARTLMMRVMGILRRERHRKEKRQGRREGYEKGKRGQEGE